MEGVCCRRSWPHLYDSRPFRPKLGLCEDTFFSVRKGCFFVLALSLDSAAAIRDKGSTLRSEHEFPAAKPPSFLPSRPVPSHPALRAPRDAGFKFQKGRAPAIPTPDLARAAPAEAEVAAGPGSRRTPCGGGWTT